VALQLFGGDPRSCARPPPAPRKSAPTPIDINMGCPVPKVTRTGAGVALLADPDRAVAVARAACEGSGLPVVVKLRAGRRIGQSEGFDLALRLADEAGVAGISFHPRSAQVRHKGARTTSWPPSWPPRCRCR
jgi:tRNA-dihydrouridine synthase